MVGIMVNRPIKIINGQGESKWAVEAPKNEVVSSWELSEMERK